MKKPITRDDHVSHPIGMAAGYRQTVISNLELQNVHSKKTR